MVYQTPCVMILPNNILAHLIIFWNLVAYPESFCWHYWGKHLMWNIVWFIPHPNYIKIEIFSCIVKFYLKSRILYINIQILKIITFFNLVFLFKFQLSKIMWIFFSKFLSLMVIKSSINLNVWKNSQVDVTFSFLRLFNVSIHTW